MLKQVILHIDQILKLISFVLFYFTNDVIFTGSISIENPLSISIWNAIHVSPNLILYIVQDPRVRNSCIILPWL